MGGQGPAADLGSHIRSRPAGPLPTLSLSASRGERRKGGGLMGFVIAVDGPAASGKGTIATRLGAMFGLPVLDTGLLYRAVGVLTERAGENPDLEEAAAAVA